VNDPQLQGAWRAHQSGNLAEAARLYGDVLSRDPAQFDALYGLGVLHYQRGEFAEAERTLKRASERGPNAAEPWFTLGCALNRMGREGEALAAFDRALGLRPGYVEALINKGGVLMAQRRHDEALASFDAALALNSAFAEGWNNRGNALCELGRFEEAVASYGRVLELRGGAPQALVNKGTALIALKRYGEALTSYTEALRADPGAVAARNGMANTFYYMKRYEDSAREYAGALRLDPDLAYGRGNLAFAKLHACDWRNLDEERAGIVAGLAARKHVVNPFQALALLDSEQDHLRAATLWMEDKYPGAARESWRGNPYKHTKIRIAYLSADFNEHAVATLMAGVFEHHDKDRFEAVAVSLAGETNSPMRARLTRAFDRFVDVEGKTDAEIAGFLRAAEADIAIDLMGFTGGCRPGILGTRPAPVQVSYLGFPGTMAARNIDYIVADRIVIPEGAANYYTEVPAYLADCCLPNDSTRPKGEARPARQDAGLPERGAVFASFNNSYKFSPTVFGVWMRILRSVPESVLWLAEPNAAAARNLRREAEARGVAPGRIVFAPFVTRAEDHLARLALADLFLDTLPYNAHSTACDALWAGLPVLSCPGSAFAGRVGASLLNAVGMPELIATSLEDYEKRAVSLARDPSGFAALKAKLMANARSSPLFDTALFTRRLEEAFTRMWVRNQRGLAPGLLD